MIREPLCIINGKYYFDNDILNYYLDLANKYLNFNGSTYLFCIEHNVPPSSFKRKMKMFGIKLKERKLKEYNRNIFNKIDTEEKAYWLGFILADGCIFRQELRIKLGIKDINHLKKFCNFIGLDEKSIKIVTHTTTKKKLCKVILASKELCDDLRKHGIHEKKSMYEEPYLNLDKNLFSHYLRGFFDGDGGIAHDFSRIAFTSSRKMNSFLRKYFIKNLSIRKTKILTKGKITDFAIYNKEDKLKVLDYLYKNSSIYLDRKYELYCRFKSTLQKI